MVGRWHTGPNFDRVARRLGDVMRTKDTMKQISKHLVVGAVSLACQLAMAQTSDPLKDAAQKAITTNPEVTARLNAYRAAADEVDVARGAYYPKVDLSADAAKIRDRVTSRSPESQ